MNGGNKHMVEVRSAVRLARLHGVQEVGGSNPLAPTRGRVLLHAAFIFMRSSISY